jgi:hypothetical protein
VTIKEDRKNAMGEAEVFAACFIPKSTLSVKWIHLLKQTTNVTLFEKASLHILGSDINRGLKKNKIKKKVRQLSKNFISGADSQKINGVEIYRKFEFYENRV